MYGLALVAGVSVVMLGAVGLLRPDGSMSPRPWTVTLVVLALPALMGASSWFFGLRRNRLPWSALGFRTPRGRYSAALPWAALFLSIAFAGLYSVTVQVLGLEALLPPVIPQDVMGEGVYRPINAFAFVVFGPLAEEVFFRGFLLTAFVPRLGPLRAALLASAIFAAFHLSLAFIPIFVSGLLLSWLYLRTGSIWTPLTAHSAQNLLAVLLVIT